MLAIVSVVVEVEFVLFFALDTGQGLRDKTRTCALICHYLRILLSNTHQSNQFLYLSREFWALCVNIRISLNSLFNCEVFCLGIEFLFSTCCVQSGVSEMCVWQPSLEEVSLDYSNHPNVRMNECRGGVYSAAAHFSSTWHKAPALFHPFFLSFFLPLQEPSRLKRQTTYTGPLAWAHTQFTETKVHIVPSTQRCSKLVWLLFLQWTLIVKNVRVFLGRF